MFCGGDDCNCCCKILLNNFSSSPCEVYEVAVDLREGSKTNGQHYGIFLSAENKNTL